MEGTEKCGEMTEPATVSDLPESALTTASASAPAEKRPQIEMGRGGKFLEKMYMIKRLVVDQWIRHGCDGDSERSRVYHFWPGKNVFFFRGRLVCGPDPRGLLFTTISIIISSWTFAFYVGKGLPNHPTLIITFSMILTLFVLVSLVLVSSIDPGIIPRYDQGCAELVSISDGTRRSVVSVNGIQMKLKYCRICKIYRPPRSCHCAVCDNCVDKFDHHCPWIGQCIALRNYRFYLMFVVTALVFFAYIFAFSCWRINQIMVHKGSGIFSVIRDCPETMALASFSFTAIGFLGALTIFHLYLIAVNQTAYENFRQRFVSSRNPYDRGIIRNFKDVLFVPFPPSQVDFRAEVTPRIWHSQLHHTVRF